MGLKTTNYLVEDMQVTLPEAYAVIRNISSDGDQGVAVIAIHENRDLALDVNVRPYTNITINFKVDRNINDRETAYKVATEPYIEKIMGAEGNLIEVTKYPAFYGWEDDIIVE